MQYALTCEDEYYLVWDGDTIPCRELNMFQEETDRPYLDLKHMLIKTDIMKSLIKDIEANENIPGTRFWEKIINAIPPEKIQSSAFSEFETYGTYVALRYVDAYVLRDWHSFRLGGEFFKIDTISDRDFEWLAKDFWAISFEKNHFVREDNANLFDNPYYQEKLTPKQMLQAAQQEFKDGYKEVWADDKELMDNANIQTGEYGNEQ